LFRRLASSRFAACRAPKVAAATHAPNIAPSKKPAANINAIPRPRRSIHESVRRSKNAPRRLDYVFDFGIQLFFGTSGGARLRGGRSARGFGRSSGRAANTMPQLGQARPSTIPVPPHSSHIRSSLMTAPDSRRRYGAEVVAQRWLAKSEARRRVHGGSGGRIAWTSCLRAQSTTLVYLLYRCAHHTGQRRVRRRTPRASDYTLSRIASSRALISLEQMLWLLVSSQW
jgi:hypothetical protein